MTRSLQKAVATSCNLATTRPATTTERIDLEATCHCRLSLASRHDRDHPDRSRTYRSIHLNLIWETTLLHHPPRTQPHQHTTHHIHLSPLSVDRSVGDNDLSSSPDRSKNPARPFIFQ